VTLHTETIIPIEDAQMVFAACRPPARAFLRVADASHNDIQFRASKGYSGAIRALLGCLSRRG